MRMPNCLSIDKDEIIALSPGYRITFAELVRQTNPEWFYSQDEVTQRSLYFTVSKGAFVHHVWDK